MLFEVVKFNASKTALVRVQSFEKKGSLLEIILHPVQKHSHHMSV